MGGTFDFGWHLPALKFVGDQRAGFVFELVAR
jgi:hypothetical protein